MTRMDFEGSLPYTIITASSGIAFLETQVLSDGAKTAQYKDKLGSVYGGVSGDSWIELYEHMQVYLKNLKNAKS